MGTACCSSRDEHADKFVNNFKLKSQGSNETQPGRDTPPIRKKKVKDKSFVALQESPVDLSVNEESIPQSKKPGSSQRVLLTVAKLMKIYGKKKGMERYQLSTVSDYLEVHSVDVGVVFSLILNDVEWRKRSLPVDKSELIKVIQTGQIYLYGSDIHTHPCVIIHANFRIIEDGALSSQPLNNLSPQDFLLFLIYGLQNLPTKLKQTHGQDLDCTHFTLIIDAQKGPFPLDVIQQIADLDARHYPMRISHIHVVNVNPKKFTGQDAFRIKTNPVFNQRGRIHTDLSQLLVDFQRHKLPQRLGGVCPSVYKYAKSKEVDDFIMSYVN